MNLSNLYKRNLSLFDKILNSSVYPCETFLHVKSYYKDIWYNFIVPTVGVNTFNFDEAQKIIEHENEDGVSVSYYVNHELYTQFKSALVALGKEEVVAEMYMYLNVNQPLQVENANKIKELSQENLQDYLNKSQLCFPEWENNRDYSLQFFEYSQKQPFTNKTVKNFVLVEQNEVVSFGSIIVDTEARLAYLHNSGTSPNHRKKGYHTELIKHRINIALEHGVNEVYAIVEENSKSQVNMQRLGFEAGDKFYIFI